MPLEYTIGIDTVERSVLALVALLKALGPDHYLNLSELLLFLGL